MLLLTSVAFAANPSADLSVNVTATPPAAAAAAGFTTLALDSEFSQPQPSGWFACSGGPAGAQWYQGVTGGDTGPAPCSITNGQPGGNFNLVTDPLTGKQALKLTMKLSDIQPNVHYASIQTADDSKNAHNGTIPCCVLGELFQYGFYAEARYRIVTTPDADHGAVAGPWSAFWQSGQGLSPFTNRAGTSIEIDHPEQHGELMWFSQGSERAGPILDWGAIDWDGGGAGACFGSILAPGGSRCGQLLQLEDPRQYHTFGVRVTTDGSTGIAYCSYADGVQSLCSTAQSTNSAEYAERKYLILFMGIQCYGGAADTTCTNVPITSWYECNGTHICLSTNGTGIPHTNSSWASSISGVSGCSSCNGSWFLLPFTNSSGGMDYSVVSGANDPTNAWPQWPGGTPTGGTVNALSQVDMYIDHVSVWTCSTWQSGPCNTPLDTGSP